MALSLVVITGFVGQISVVQLSLAGVAGFVISRLTHDHGVPFPWRTAGRRSSAAVLLGLMMAVSALRVRGVQPRDRHARRGPGDLELLLRQPELRRRAPAGRRCPSRTSSASTSARSRRSAASTATSRARSSAGSRWSTAVALCLLVGYLRRGGFGRRMLAVRSNERASAAAAINPRIVKLIAFGVSALIAGRRRQRSTPTTSARSRPISFDAFTALSLIAFAYAGGITMISGAVFAGLISTQALFPYALEKWFGLSGNYVPAVRRRDPDRHAAAEPRGRRWARSTRRRHRKRRSSRRRSATARRRQRRRRGAAPARREPRPARPAGPPVLADGGPVGRFRRRPRAARRQLRGRRGRARRADRAQRRRQDDVRRRGHRLRQRRAGG